jgi:hypothetical protein
MDYSKERKLICEKYGSLFIDSPESLKIGISKNVKDGIWPINGMRHPLEGDTTGWYIWAGEEFSTDPDFFVPLHVEHLNEWNPIVLKYLGLAPGWRFLVTDDYEDVWYDASLLEI